MAMALPLPSEGGMTELTLTAYHEAGHAVVALATGCTLGRVRVQPNGWCAFVAPQGLSPERARRDAVLRHLAGAAAEAIALGEDVEFREAERRCGGGRVDFAAARRAAGPGEESYCSSRWTRVIGLLSRRWSSVEALARALEQEGEIQGARAAELAEGVCR